MNAYCDRQSVDLNAIAFLFDGRRLRAEQTPDEVLSHITLTLISSFFPFFELVSFTKPWILHFYQLDMEDGDEIDAMLHQTGGVASGGMYLFWF